MNFSFDILNNPAMFQQNRLPAHADHPWFPTEADCASASNPAILSLNGDWKFDYATNDNEVKAGFEDTSFDCSAWATIHVPGHIQMQGYDRPQYANQQYPWDGKENVALGEVPKKFNPVACYVKYFTLSDEMSGKRIFLSMQGVESCAAVFLNGTYIGYSSNSFSPCEFELTDALVSGENKLAIRVYKWNCGSWLEDQDFFRFSGIYRDVYLYAAEDLHVQDLKIDARIAENLTDATVTIEGTFLGDVSAAAIALSLRDTTSAAASGNASLLCGNPALLSSCSDSDENLQLSACPEVIADTISVSGNTFKATYEIQGPKLWSAELPNLYTLTLTVKDAAGNEKEYIKQVVGFRRFEMKDGLMLLNNKRIVFKGVNRHDFSADVGRAVTKDHILRDLLTMKRNNINGIRTSHYPNNAYLYELCDLLGFYVIAENNMETHGTWQNSKDREALCLPGDRQEWKPMMFDRIDSTYETTKNHPSVIIWSIGNESFGGTVTRDMADRFRELDDTRLVHYEGVFNDRRYSKETSDMESQMYPFVSAIEKFLDENPDKPFICCEYAHSMGNSTGALFYYTDLTDRNPRYQGGFIWDYMDQAILGKDRYGNDTYYYGGDLDDRPCDYSFSGNGICNADGTPSPKMPEVKYDYQNISVTFDEDEFTIENKNLFINTNTFDCVISLSKEGKLIYAASFDTDVAPLSKKTYALPFEEGMEYGEYALVVSFRLKNDTPWAKAGHEVAYGEDVYTIEEVLLEQESDENALVNVLPVEKTEAHEGAPLEILDTDFNIGVIGSNFNVLFSKLDGGLVSYRYEGKEMLKNIPRPNFWRPMVENDFGGQINLKCAQWKIASMYVSHRQYGKGAWNADYNPVLSGDEKAAQITYTYHMPTTPASDCTVTYTIYPDGVVKCDLDYKAVKGLAPMPEFGMIMKISADYNNIEWYGRGPEETYCDRMHGAKLGIYKGLVEEQFAKYLRPQECGNHADTRWAKVTDANGFGLCFQGDGMNFSALPWTPHEIDCAEHIFELPPVHYTVIRLSEAQMGVGGDDTWGSIPHPEFWLPEEKDMHFTFTFCGCK